jgi:MarR family transcriptional regulator for hemolysin
LNIDGRRGNPAGHLLLAATICDYNLIARYNNVAYFIAMHCFDRDMLILLHDVARMQRTRFDQWARNYGMTRAQGLILTRLERQPGLSQNEMAALCEVEPITIGRLVERLEARGFLERRADPSDRRIRRLHLLPAAAPILAAIQGYKTALEEYVTEGLEPGVQEAVIDALVHMKTKLIMETERPLQVAGE